MVKNTCAICLPAAAGTEIARRFQRIPSRFSPSNKVYSKSALIPSFTKYRPVRRKPIAEYSALLPPKEIGPCLSSDVAVDSLEPTMDQWLGWAFTPPTTLNPGTSHPGADHLLSSGVGITACFQTPGEVSAYYSPVHRTPEDSDGRDSHVSNVFQAFLQSQNHDSYL